jgi:RNA polymerase sigma factor (sigma-70 family)
VDTEAADTSSPFQGNVSLCEQRAVQRQLLAIANRLKADPVYWGLQDLLQEGLARIWRVQKERPGETLSWYLQNAQSYLRDLLKSGRSLDSPKHRSGRVALSKESDDESDRSQAAAALEDDRDLLSQVYRDEIVELLHRSLNGLNNVILDLSLEGRGTREIGRRLDLDHATVIKRLRRVVTIANELNRIAALGPAYKNSSHHVAKIFPCII